MPSFKHIVIALASAALGAYTFYYLNTFQLGATQLKPVMEKARAEFASGDHVTGLQQLDELLLLLKHFFRHTIDARTGTLVMCELFGLVFAFVGAWALESIRTRTQEFGTLMLFLGTFLQLSQFLGISVVCTLLYVPLFIVSLRHSSKSPYAYSVRASGVFHMCLVLSVLGVFTASMFYLTGRAFAVATYCFNLCPFFIGLVNWVLGVHRRTVTTQAQAERGAEAARALHLVIVGASLTLRVIGVLSLLPHFPLLSDPVAAVQAIGAEFLTNAYIHFLVIDGVVTALGATFFLLADHTHSLHLVQLVVLSVLFSSGVGYAVQFYRREKRLTQATAAAPTKKTN